MTPETERQEPRAGEPGAMERRMASLEKDAAAIRARLDATLPTLATKAEVETLKAEIRQLATKAELERVRTEVETVRTEVHRMGMVIVMWNVGTIIATAGIVVALLRWFGGAP